MEQQRGSFSSQLGFMFAIAGSAIGLGNLWRFPYLADSYGGGAFMIIYFIFMILFGMVLMMTEVAIGRRTGKSIIEAFRDLTEKYAIIGKIAAVIPFLILPFYCVIGGWVLKYLFESAAGNIDQMADGTYFNTFLATGPENFLASPLPWFLLFFGVTFLLPAMGVRKGIEKISKFMMPALLILIVLLVVHMLLFEGAGGAMVQFLSPDFSQVSAETVVYAAGQVFFSMSLAMGITITYGSYMTKDTDIRGTTFQVTAASLMVSVLAGLMIIPAVTMYAGSASVSGPGLMFEVLPMAFNNMNGGSVLAMAFFILVFLAALTSSVSVAETLICEFSDYLKKPRLRMILMCLIPTAILGCIIAYDHSVFNAIHLGDNHLLEMFDFLSSSVLVPIVAIATCLVVGYIVKPKYIEEEITKSGPFMNMTLYSFLIKVVCPIIIGVIFIAGLLSYF